MLCAISISFLLHFLGYCQVRHASLASISLFLFFLTSPISSYPLQFPVHCRLPCFPPTPCVRLYTCQSWFLIFKVLGDVSLLSHPLFSPFQNLLSSPPCFPRSPSLHLLFNLRIVLRFRMLCDASLSLFFSYINNFLVSSFSYFTVNSTMLLSPFTTAVTLFNLRF